MGKAKDNPARRLLAAWILHTCLLEVGSPQGTGDTHPLPIPSPTYPPTRTEREILPRNRRSRVYYNPTKTLQQASESKVS